MYNGNQGLNQNQLFFNQLCTLVFGLVKLMKVNLSSFKLMWTNILHACLDLSAMPGCHHVNSSEL